MNQKCGKSCVEGDNWTGHSGIWLWDMTLWMEKSMVIMIWSEFEKITAGHDITWKISPDDDWERDPCSPEFCLRLLKIVLGNKDPNMFKQLSNILEYAWKSRLFSPKWACIQCWEDWSVNICGWPVHDIHRPVDLATWVFVLRKKCRMIELWDTLGPLVWRKSTSHPVVFYLRLMWV